MKLLVLLFCFLLIPYTTTSLAKEERPFLPPYITAGKYTTESNNMLNSGCNLSTLAMPNIEPVSGWVNHGQSTNLTCATGFYALGNKTIITAKCENGLFVLSSTGGCIKPCNISGLIDNSKQQITKTFTELNKKYDSSYFQTTSDLDFFIEVNSQKILSSTYIANYSIYLEPGGSRTLKCPKDFYSNNAQYILESQEIVDKGSTIKCNETGSLYVPYGAFECYHKSTLCKQGNRLFGNGSVIDCNAKKFICSNTTDQGNQCANWSEGNKNCWQPEYLWDC